MTSNGEYLLLWPGGLYPHCLIPEDAFLATLSVVTLDTCEGSDSDDWTVATVRAKDAAAWNPETDLRPYCINPHGIGTIETGPRDSRLLGIFYFQE